MNCRVMTPISEDNFADCTSQTGLPLPAGMSISSLVVPLMSFSSPTPRVGLRTLLDGIEATSIKENDCCL